MKPSGSGSRALFPGGTGEPGTVKWKSAKSGAPCVRLLGAYHAEERPAAGDECVNHTAFPIAELPGRRDGNQQSGPFELFALSSGANSGT